MRTVVIISLLGLMLAGCNTMEGLGTDIRKAGSSLEMSAEKHNPATPSQTPHPSNNRDDRNSIDNQTYQSAPVENTY